MTVEKQPDGLEISLLQRMGPTVSYPRGHLIFSAGELADRVFLVQEGVCSIYRLVGDGRKQMVALRYPGDLIGVAETLHGGERSCYAESVTALRLVIIHYDAFVQLMQNDALFATAIARILGGRLREAHATIGDLAFYRVPGRVAALLLKLADACGRPLEGGPGLRISLRLTHEELAHMVGTSRPNVTAVLNTFRQQGIIEMRGREIHILDPARLIGWE